MKFQSFIPFLTLTSTVLAQEKAINNMHAAFSGITSAIKQVDDVVLTFAANDTAAAKSLTALFPKLTGAIQHGADRIEDVASMKLPDSNKLVDHLIQTAGGMVRLADDLDWKRPDLVSVELRRCVGSWLYEELQGFNALNITISRKTPAQHKNTYQAIIGVITRNLQTVTDVFGGSAKKPTTCGMDDYPYVSSSQV